MKHISRFVARVVVSLAGLSSLFAAATTRADSIFDYNVVVTGAMTSNNGHVHGTTIVGGSLQANGVAEFGADLLPRPSYASTYTLKVGGAIGGNTVRLFAGQLQHGGPLGATLDTQGSPVVPTLNAPFSAAAYAAEMASVSDYFKNLPAQSTFSFVPNSLTLDIVAQNVVGLGNVAVFDLPGTTFAANTQMKFLDAAEVAGVDAIIINVSGTSLTPPSSFNMNGAGFTHANAPKILYNFWEATTLDFQTQVFGSILAPLASLTKSNSEIRGGVYVQNLTLGGQIHPEIYDGPRPPAIVPLPPAALAGAGLLATMLLGKTIRRRSRA